MTQRVKMRDRRRAQLKRREAQPTVADLRALQEATRAVSVQPDDAGIYTFLAFASEADRKAYEQVLRASGKALPKGTVLTP